MGKRTLGVCDRCGFTYRLSELNEEFKNDEPTNIFTCRSCFDEDHPQNRIGKFIFEPNPVAIINPKPDISELQSRSLSRFNPVNGVDIDISIGRVRIGS